MNYLKFEEQFKNLLSNIILSYISQFNKTLKKTKVVIAGGSALNYYFRKSEAQIFETHDFDLRFVYDDYIRPEEDDIITEQLETQQMIFINNLIYELNTLYRTQTYVFEEIVASIRKIAPDFSFILTPNNELFYNHYENLDSDLHIVGYIYTLNGREYRASMVDTLVESRKIASEYGYPDKKDDGSEYTLDELIDLYINEDEIAFVKNYLALTPEDGTVVDAGNGLYYASLGYVVWDTIRMLNVTATRQKAHKYKRYVEKYVKIIQAFNNPRKYLRCNCAPLFQYAQNCFL